MILFSADGRRLGDKLANTNCISLFQNRFYDSGNIGKDVAFKIAFGEALDDVGSKSVLEDITPENHAKLIKKIPYCLSRLFRGV